MNNDIVKQIKDANPLVPFAERHGFELKKTSNKTFVSVCCFHNEKTPSLTFYPLQGRYKCFGCGAHGDVINLYAHLHGGIPMKQAIKEMAQELTGKTKRLPPVAVEHSRIYSGFKKLASSFNFKKEVIETTAEELPPTDIYKTLFSLCGGITGEALEYMKGRGFTEDTLKHFNIFSIQDGKEIAQQLRGMYPLKRLQQTSLLSEKNQFLFSQHTIVFPLIENGEIIALRARYFYKGSHKTERGKYRSTPNVQHKLFNGDLLKTLPKGERLYLCEGEIDTMTLTQMGKNAVGLLGVGNYNEDLVARLKDFDLVVALDNDGSGTYESTKICRLYWKLTGNEAKKEKLPEGIKDINELYMHRLKQH